MGMFLLWATWAIFVNIDGHRVLKELEVCDFDKSG